MSYAMEVTYAVALWGSVNGKITSPYWLGRYGPRSRSAIFQIRLALVCATVRVVPSSQFVPVEVTSTWRCQRRSKIDPFPTVEN